MSDEPKPPTFPNGESYLIGYRRELPSGQRHVEIVLPEGERKRVLLDYSRDTPEVHAELAQAMREGRRIVKGRIVGGTG